MPKDAYNRWMCWHRTKRCQNEACADPETGYPHRYSRAEYELWACPLCGNDRHCRNPVAEDGKACFLHGGKSLVGQESPSFVHGRRSQIMPRGLREDYEDFLKDPNRLAVESEMALVRSLVWERVGSLEEGPSKQAWLDAQRLWKQCERDTQTKNREAFARHFYDLGQILEKGSTQAATREEIRKLVEQERKLVDTQRQIYVDMGEFITRGVALMMMQNFLEAVREHVIPLEGGKAAVTAIAGAVGGMVGRLRPRSAPARVLHPDAGPSGLAPGRERLADSALGEEIHPEQSGPDGIPF